MNADSDECGADRMVNGTNGRECGLEVAFWRSNSDAYGVDNSNDREVESESSFWMRDRSLCACEQRVGKLDVMNARSKSFGRGGMVRRSI